MSTLAIEGSGSLGTPGRAVVILRNIDLLVLALAAIPFVTAGWSMLGYAVVGGVWLAQRLIMIWTGRYAARALRRGDRRTALGVQAAVMLGRVWTLALAILIVGLSDREAGLAGAGLAAGLVTAYLGGTILARLISGEEA